VGGDISCLQQGTEVIGQVQQEETRTESLRLSIRSTVTNALANGRALLLVDGLDEVSFAEQAAILSLLGQIGSNTKTALVVVAKVAQALEIWAFLPCQTTVTQTNLV
jgi:hypothetical protein